MIHKDWYQEVIESQASSLQTEKKQKDNLVSVKALKEAPEPGTSSQGNSIERQQVSVLTSWSSARSASDL